jgi:TPR repeat protein
VVRNVEEGLRLIRKAAEKGSPYGEFLLGRCYQEGIGAPKDLAEAARWYKKSVEHGYGPASKALQTLMP